MCRLLLPLLFVCAAVLIARAQTAEPPVLPLYAGPIPDSRPSSVQEKVLHENGKIRISDVVEPTLTVFRAPADQANGTAVVICPGGGYARLAIDHEGYDVARRLNQMGITAFVLKYRLPNAQSQPNKTNAPLLDVQQAIRLVRQRSQAFGVKKVGLIGFSAGGHLAAMAGTTHRVVPGNLAGTVSATSCWPDFLVLIYPVISFSDELAHRGSRANLLGESPTSAQIQDYSADRQVTAQTPPTFLVHAQDDKSVPVQNSLAFYEACTRHGVAAEMHLYPRGGHGFGMRNLTTQDDWTNHLRNWLDAGGWRR